MRGGRGSVDAEDPDYEAPWPYVGEVVCDCRFLHLAIIAIDDNQDTVTLADGHTCSYAHCCDTADHEWLHPAGH